jgi:hypothetical protein
LLLQKAEAIAMDRAHVQRGQAIQCLTPEPDLDTSGNPIRQFMGSPLGERECHNPLGCHPIGQEVSHPLRHHLGLSGAGGGNNLEMRTTVPHRL